VALGLLIFSCGDSKKENTQQLQPPTGSSSSAVVENAALGGDVGARVGTQPIPLSVIQSVANAQKISANDAARRVIDDEIAAAAARARGLDQKNPAASRLVSARARFISDRLFQEAKKAGPPTDEEVRALSVVHWQEVDRPPSLRVIHAIVLRPEKPTPALLEEAKNLAEALRTAVKDASSAEEFQTKANGVTHPDALKVKVETLPPFTDDGWATEGGGRMDETFAKAAFVIPTIGGTSPIVETNFGFHVIRSIERIPEKRMPIETRRVAFQDEVNSRRARKLYEALVKPLRETKRIEVSPAAETLMRSVMQTEAVPVVASSASPSNPADPH